MADQGKELEKLVKDMLSAPIGALNEAVRGIKKLGSDIDDLLKAPGRFAEIVKEIEEKDLVGRFSVLLNQLETTVNDAQEPVRELSIAVDTFKKWPEEMKKEMSEWQKMYGALFREVKGKVKAGISMVKPW